MFLQIEDLLNPQEVARLLAISGQMKFVNGRLTNPAMETKDNVQADLGDPRYAESAKLVGDALQRSREFMSFAFPKKIAPPLMARYEPGMKYGAHADTAFMSLPGTSATLRSDLSCTVFLSDPSTYEGGELVIHLGTKPVAFKGPPGSAVVYPSTQLHEVIPVRAGVRLVSLSFIESLIADEYKRTQLYELNEVAELEGLKINWDSRVRLEVVRNNLLRMWSNL